MKILQPVLFAYPKIVLEVPINIKAVFSVTISPNVGSHYSRCTVQY